MHEGESKELPLLLPLESVLVVEALDWDDYYEVDDYVEYEEEFDKIIVQLPSNKKLFEYFKLLLLLVFGGCY